MELTLTLVRHGTTPGNLSGRFVGSTDMPLASEGMHLALDTRPMLPPVEHLYVSPMLRCRQTAALVWPGIDATLVPDLRESDFGPLEGQLVHEVKDHPMYLRWLQGDVDPEGGIEDCRPRVTEAVRWLAQDALSKGFSDVGVVAHGGVIMGLMSQWGLPARKFIQWLLPNCGGYRVKCQLDPLELRLISPVGQQGKTLYNQEDS